MPSLELAASVNPVGIKPGTSQWARYIWYLLKLSPSSNAFSWSPSLISCFFPVWWLFLDGCMQIGENICYWRKENCHYDQKVTAVIILTPFFYLVEICCRTCSDNDGTVFKSHEHVNLHFPITGDTVEGMGWSCYVCNLDYSGILWSENGVFWCSVCFDAVLLSVWTDRSFTGMLCFTCAFNSTFFYFFPTEPTWMFWALWAWKQLKCKTTPGNIKTAFSFLCVRANGLKDNTSVRLWGQHVFRHVRPPPVVCDFQFLNFTFP